MTFVDNCEERVKEYQNKIKHINDRIKATKQDAETFNRYRKSNLGAIKEHKETKRLYKVYLECAKEDLKVAKSQHNKGSWRWQEHQERVLIYLISMVVETFLETEY